MFIRAIKFKRDKESFWEEGYFIGDDLTSQRCTILDRNYTALPKSKDGSIVYDMKKDLENPLELYLKREG